MLYSYQIPLDFIMSYIGFAIKSYVVKSNYPKISHIQHEIVAIFLFAIIKKSSIFLQVDA